MPQTRFTPTIFDKIASNLQLTGISSEGLDRASEFDKRSFRFHTTADLERFNEQAVRATVMRELAWLLNTVNLDSTVDLTPYPQVRTSVLNYGINDMTGKSTTSQAQKARAARIKSAIETFEPRIDSSSLKVETDSTKPRDQLNTTRYIVHCDISQAVEAIPVRFVTDFENDTGDATVKG